MKGEVSVELGATLGSDLEATGRAIRRAADAPGTVVTEQRYGSPGPGVNVIDGQ